MGVKEDEEMRRKLFVWEEDDFEVVTPKPPIKQEPKK